MAKSYARSKELHERACRVLAGGVSSEFRKFNQPHPLFYERAAGSRIVDVDGNEFLDFTLSQGPLILGHSHPRVLEAVRRASEEGQLFAGQHRAELELAERIQRLVPCAQVIRFSLSGSEAVHAALRLARAVTGRPKFIRFEGHYHGWLDNVAFGVTGSTPDGPIPWTEGLPPHALDEAIVLPWNDVGAVEQAMHDHGGEIAAIITEPVMCNSGCIVPEPGYLGALRDLCDRQGSLLIFDEVITGFRVGLGGAQRALGVTPDLAIFGKALASGYPMSVLAGRRSCMHLVEEGRVIHAGTMNAGNPCVAAALATLDELEAADVHDRLYRLGGRLMAGLREAAELAGRSVLVQGLGPMFWLGFTKQKAVRDLREVQVCDRAQSAKFVWEMQERGIRLIGRGLWYVSAAHTDEDVETALAAAREAMGAL